jgi:photosystem II stability/assembly factor-like uncharacterized protein
MKKLLIIPAMILLMWGCDTQRQNQPVSSANLPVSEETSREISARRWKKTNLKDISIFDFETNQEGKLMAGTSEGLFISPDDGNTWDKVASELIGGQQINCLEKTDSIMFAGVGAYGVYISEDFGYTWEKSNQGFSPAKKIIVKDILCKNGVIYIGCNLGLYISLDQGINWRPANTGLPVVKKTGDSLMRITAVHDLMEDGKKVYALTEAGVAVSSNEGNTWEYPRHEGLFDKDMISSIARFNNSMVAGKYLKDGVYYSGDNGDTWRKAGLHGQNLHKVFVSPNNIIYAGTVGNGLFRSVNMGKDWNQFNQGLPENVTILTLGHSKDGSILVGTEHHGIYKLVY